MKPVCIDPISPYQRIVSYRGERATILMLSLVHYVFFHTLTSEGDLPFSVVCRVCSDAGASRHCRDI